MKHTLKNGIVVEDYRHLQSGVIILNQNNKYFTIVHSRRWGIELYRTALNEIEEEDFDSYINEFKEAVKSYREIKKLLKI